MLVTAQQLRDIAEAYMRDTIAVRRGSLSANDPSYISRGGGPTEDEIDEFLFGNPILNDVDVEHLCMEGFWPYHHLSGEVSEGWLDEFREACRDWAINNSWLGGDDLWLVARPDFLSSSETWTPDEVRRPLWVNATPSCVMLAREILRQGGLLSELPWRRFEELVAEMLRDNGWEVKLTKATKDGGIDVVGTRDDLVLGPILSLWQAKRYGPGSLVRINEVRELSAVVEEQRATKGILITTSRLTRDAIEWIRRDHYRLDFKDHDRLTRWLVSGSWNRLE